MITRRRDYPDERRDERYDYDDRRDERPKQQKRETAYPPPKTDR